jgi:hypothetical protein
MGGAALERYSEVWLVTFDFERLPGERPRPRGLVAREYRTGRVLHLKQEGLRHRKPPYSVGEEDLFVTYDAAPALGCHLALRWPMPTRVLDLHAEFRCATAGLDLDGDYRLQHALAHYGLAGDGPDALAALLDAVLPQLDLPRALLRGRYTAAVARMEAVGIPLDTESLGRLRYGWDAVRDQLIERVDQQFGVFSNGKFNPQRWAAWLNRHGIRWPRQDNGHLDLTDRTFRDMAAAYPEVAPMHQLRATLSQMRPFRLAVGADGRNRTPLRAFASKTGRNQPSTAEFIFGPATWLRGLIQPADGTALAYLDYEQQEFGIAAALSKDEAMMEAYRTGDPYLTFAKQAGAVPADATKLTHDGERERFKKCALGVQYGMGAKSLGIRLGVDLDQARELLQLHKTTYPTYWRWSKEVGRQARKFGRLRAAFGWTLQVPRGANPRSVRNFPLQANGAEMLRLACIMLTERGIRVCAPVHDALLIEAPAGDIDTVVRVCQREMERASEVVLEEFPLRTEAKVVRHPDRYMDSRGQAMWDTVFRLLEQRAGRAVGVGVL